MILLFLLFYALTICCAARLVFCPKASLAPGNQKAGYMATSTGYVKGQTRPATSFKCGSAAGRLAVTHSGGVAFLQLQLRGGR